MPLPPELDKRIRKRFDELIEEANAIGSNTEHEAYVVKVLSLTYTVFGSSERGREIEKRINRHLAEWIDSVARTYITGILRGLKDDYENGFLGNLEERIIADISADYITQVEELLGEGRYVPAAVLCGAVLEDSLRRLCERQTPPVETANENGRLKNLNSLIQDLQKANAFNKLKAQQLRGWAQVRNCAAHGKFDEFSRDDVELMVKGVTNFLADYL